MWVKMIGSLKTFISSSELKNRNIVLVTSLFKKQTNTTSANSPAVSDCLCELSHQQCWLFFPTSTLHGVK